MALIQDKRKTSGAFVAAAIAIAFSCAALGQEQPQKKEAETKTEAQGQTVIVPDASVLRSIFDEVVKIFRDEKTAGEASEKRKERREEADLVAQEKMAEWTKWIGIFAFVQLLVTAGTLYFLWRTFQQAKRTADGAVDAARAATISANAAVAAETARFHIVIEDTNFDQLIARIKPNYSPVLKDGQSVETPFRIEYRFRNYGKTPGFLKEICVDATVSSEPVDVVYHHLLDEVPENMIGGNGETHRRRFLSLTNPMVEQVRAIERNEARLWFYGSLDYEDVFGNPHKHRFYFRTVYFNGHCFLQAYDFKHYNKSG